VREHTAGEAPVPAGSDPRLSIEFFRGLAPSARIVGGTAP